MAAVSTTLICPRCRTAASPHPTKTCPLSEEDANIMAMRMKAGESVDLGEPETPPAPPAVPATQPGGPAVVEPFTAPPDASSPYYEEYTRLTALERELDQLHSQCLLWVGKLREARDLVAYFKQHGPTFRRMHESVAKAKDQLAAFMEAQV